MNYAESSAIVTRHPVGPAPREAYTDPLDPDLAIDAPILVTRRRLIRLALVATEAGARFQREASEHDTMAWMLAPRKLFGGRDAIDATLEREHCMRALLLHGLGLGLDALPADIDELSADPEPVRVRSPRKAGRRGSTSNRAPSSAKRVATGS